MDIIWRSKQNSGFCGTTVQVGLYSGTTLPDERCPNCCRRETADHLLLCSNEDRTQLLIKNTGVVVGKRRNYGPGVIILDTLVHTDAGQHTICRFGSNVPLHEGIGQESSKNNLVQYKTTIKGHKIDCPQYG
jgi:hypothetical protein